jgi:high affinity sulfate transporter 1
MLGPHDLHAEHPALAREARLNAPIARAAPGLAALLRYRREDLPHDLAAGLAVAAVAIPSSIAAAQLAGLPPVVGLYGCLLPQVAYALFGTSPQLMLGPSAVGAAIVASGVAPLAVGVPERYADYAMALTLVTGLICIAASWLRLGGLMDFFSKPILVGFLNGVAIDVMSRQGSRLFGIAVEGDGILSRARAFLSSLPQAHWPTLAVGLGTIAVLVVAPRLVRRVPATLIAIVVAALAVRIIALAPLGVATLESVEGGLPALRWPALPLDKLTLLVGEAAGIALVIFTMTMAAARSFADRNRYDIDADREIVALGVANVAAALSQSFAVNGATSRTAAGEVAGARTQMTGIVAAVAIALVLLFFSGLLAAIPRVALSAVLVVAAFALFDWRTMLAIRRIDQREFWIGMTATVGVVAVGVINGILVAVVLALVSFLRLVSRPQVECLGAIPGQPGFHAIARHPEAVVPEGLVLLRFDGPVVFFSAPFFKREVQKAALDAGPGLRWFVIDLMPVNLVDATGLYAMREAIDELRARGVVVGAATREAQWAEWAETRGLAGELERVRFFPSLRQAVKAYRREVMLMAESEAGDELPEEAAP